MTIAAELETRVARPPHVVFGALLDLEGYPAWLIASGIVAVSRLDDGPLQPGTRVRIEQRVAGRASVLEGAVTEVEADRRFGLRARDRDGVSIQIDAALAADGEDACRLRWSVRVDLPLRLRMFESMVAPQARRAAALDLEALRRRLEAVPADGGTSG